jgi:hypothetical protein
VSFQDINGDGIPEIVSFEAAHNGTDDWREYYHYYAVTPELSLKRVLTRPAYACVPVPGQKANASLYSQWTPLGKGRLRIEVLASGLPSVTDGARLAAYTCEQTSPTLPFAVTARRFEDQSGAQSWARSFFGRALEGD